MQNRMKIQFKGVALFMDLSWILLIIAVIYIVAKRADIVARIGHIRHAKGNTSGALQAFKFANKIGNMSNQNKISYGYFLLRLGELNEARKVLNFVSMNASPKKPTIKHSARAMLALVLWKNGELDDGIEMMEDVFENYKNSIIYQGLGLMYLQKKDKARALEFNLEAYEYNSSDKIIVDNLAESYVMNGNMENAKEIYEKLLEMNPHFPEAFFGFGKLLIELGEHERGIELVKQALDKPFAFLSTITRDDVERFLSQQISLSS